MRYAAGLVVLLVLAVAGYLLSPVWIAMDLRRAALAGDTATLEARVDWPAVRLSLKQSLADLERARDAENAKNGLPRPSLWTRIKASASPARYADQIIDRYVSADGIVKAVAARGQLKQLLGQTGQAAEADTFDVPDHARPLLDRAQRFWARIKRVSFTSATELEIEFADRKVAARSYLGRLVFADLRWRLVDVRVLGAGF